MRLQSKLDQTRQKMRTARSILRHALTNPTVSEAKWTEATTFLVQQIRHALDAMPEEFVPEAHHKHSGENVWPELAALPASHDSNVAHAENSSGGEPKGKPAF